MPRVVLIALVCAALTLAQSPRGLALEGSGTLDRSFGEAGESVFQANPACHPYCVETGGSYAESLLLETDGKIVLGGRRTNIGAGGPGAESPGALIRLDADGGLDTSFGIAGEAPSPPFAVEALAALPGGGLLAAGDGPAGTGIERYTREGLPDESFAPGGLRWLRRLSSAGIAIDRAGHILVLAERIPKLLEVMRYLPSGALDVTFGTKGIVRLYGAPEADPAGLAPTREGGVVLSGDVTVQGSSKSRPVIVRLTRSGRVDRAFGKGGYALGPPSTVNYGAGPVLGIAPEGQIVIASGEDPASEEHRNKSDAQQERLRVFRFTKTGRLSRGFGRVGVAMTTVVRSPGGRRGLLSPNAVAFDPAGDPVVVGSDLITTIDTGSAGSWFIARYTDRGRDCAFGAGGIAFGSARGSAQAAAVQPDGRIVLAGDRDHAFMATRYTGAGTPRTCPGEGLSPRQRRPIPRGRIPRGIG